ncbi:MAG: response regulator [Calditrichaeota bacterium]|nr:response regulator [Calditrichota bacterium]MCB0305824.1 response regulator [Calditrichota bacterium]MCB9089402.1 response regulator [Calditrichia bacterium]
MSKILIVEDEAAQRLLYETEIVDLGHEVVLASDGVEAIDMVRKEKPDLVILDLMMPNMHGLDSLRKVLSINPNIPVIIHTAYSHYKDNFMSWAAEEYIVKSADLSELKGAIKRVLASRTVSK